MAAKTCPICQNRPMYTGKGPGTDEAPRLSEMCNFCFTEGGWENTHNDDSHDALKNGGGDADEFGGQEQLDAVLQTMESCWICNPKLNLAQKPVSERAGTSRQGMRLTVSVRADGKTKAGQVASQIPDGFKVTVRTEKGNTILRAKGAVNVTLIWDAQRGAFRSGTAQATNGTARKVRNASEALRLMGA